MAAFLPSKQAVRVQIPLFAPRRCGGIGRRGGLKIPLQKCSTGSTPVTGTSSETPLLARIHALRRDFLAGRGVSSLPNVTRCAWLTFGEDIVPCKLDLSTMRTSNSVNKACQRSEVRRIFGQSGEGYLFAEFVFRPVMGGRNAETADKNVYR